MTKKKSNKRGKPTPKPKKASKRGKKVVSKKRRPNRYNAIRSATSKYCKEKYNSRCPNTKLNAIYRELKKKYDKVPLEKVLEKVDTYIDNIERSVAPEIVTADDAGLEWFYMEDLVSNKNLKYFKPKDKLTFDLGLVDEGKFTTTYKNFPKFYRDKLYPILNQKKSIRVSPVPVFKLNTAKTDPSSREFVWDLEGNLAEEDTIKPKVIKQRGVESDLSPKEKLEASRLREKALDRLDKRFDAGIFTKEEYKKKYEEIMNKYNKGGTI